MQTFIKTFLKNCDDEGDEGYIVEVDIQYIKDLHDLHSDLSFLPERMKINKCNKLVCNVYNKNNFVMHIIHLRQALNHGLILKKRAYSNSI